jgi:IclR family pca regulon transcriptional regulator
MNIEMLTKTYLEDLARQTGDSAALTVLDGAQIVYVARTSVRTLMRLEAHVGSRFPAYPTSMGRVLLAGLSAERLEKYFASEQFVPLTSHTVTDPVGYSAVEDELAYGVVAVAVPVYDQSQRVVAALNTSSHSKRISKAKLVRERLALLQELSAQISRELLRVPGLSLSAQN